MEMRAKLHHIPEYTTSPVFTLAGWFYNKLPHDIATTKASRAVPSHHVVQFHKQEDEVQKLV